jgi:hypothetical protein
VTGWNTADSAQLAAWLHLAAWAQEAQAPATAIRLYFLVLEELAEVRVGAGALAGEEFACLSALHDFVSHREITRPKTKERLRTCAAALAAGPDAFWYRPGNQQQQAILQEWRLKARNIVDTELQRRLGIPSPYGVAAG